MTTEGSTIRLRATVALKPELAAQPDDLPNFAAVMHAALTLGEQPHVSDLALSEIEVEVRAHASSDRPLGEYAAQIRAVTDLLHERFAAEFDLRHAIDEALVEHDISGGCQLIVARMTPSLV